MLIKVPNDPSCLHIRQVERSPAVRVWGKITMAIRGLRTILLLAVIALPGLAQLPAAAADTNLRISLSPTSGPIGSDITISGSGASPGSTVWVYSGDHGPPVSPARRLPPVGTHSRARQQPIPTARLSSRFPPGPLSRRVEDLRASASWRQSAHPLVLGNPQPTPGAIVSNVACFRLTPPPSGRYFPQTGYIVANGFLAYWKHFGGVSTFGYPISQEYHSCNNEVPQWCGTVQYFDASSSSGTLVLTRPTMTLSSVCSAGS